MKPIISSNCRIRHPGDFFVDEYSIVDDFCYFSTQVRLGKFCHVAAGCHIAGGKERLFTFGDYSSLSAGVKIWLASDDYVNDVIAIIHEGFPQVKDHFIVGDVSLGKYTGVGSNAVIMPDNQVPDGVAIGALSFVPPRFSFERWMVYAGTPIRPIKARNKENVLRQVRQLEERLMRERDSK